MDISMDIHIYGKPAGRGLQFFPTNFSPAPA